MPTKLRADHCGDLENTGFSGFHYFPCNPWEFMASNEQGPPFEASEVGLADGHLKFTGGNSTLKTYLGAAVKDIFMTICFIIAAAGSTAFAQLPGGQSTLFSGSNNCAVCHASNGQANTENGIDVSPVTQWRSTMMANAARDPLWRAKVSAEIATFPALAEDIETKCTRCHAPMGNFEAEYHGAPGYSISEMINDPLALDGVSCTLCHQIQPDNLGASSSYSGHFQVDDSGVIFGPYSNPLVGPMQMMSGYTPTPAAHTATSELWNCRIELRRR
jgi:hypothetical protein